MQKRNTKQRSIHLTDADIERADYLTVMMEMSFSAMVRALMKDAAERLKATFNNNQRNESSSHG